MTTYVTFTPSPLQPFQFQATLDGQQYTIIVTWNLFGQRWYINIYDLSGNLVAVLPLIGSAQTIHLTSLVWNQLAGQVDVTAALPLPFALGQEVNLVLFGNAPTAFNGPFRCDMTGANTFTYQMTSDPGQITAYGFLDYGLNLTAGYFKNSTLIYRTQSGQFEVTP